MESWGGNGHERKNSGHPETTIVKLFNEYGITSEAVAHRIISKYEYLVFLAGVMKSSQETIYRHHQIC